MGTNDLERLTAAVAERAAGLTLYARQWLEAAAAEDVVQEALVRLLAQRRPPDKPIAWMYRVVRNAAIDAARSTARRRQREESVARSRREWLEARPESLLDAEVAEQALRQLAPDLRQVVVLRIWGELGFAEIADIMQLSVSTVHGRYASALSQLRIALEKPCQNKTG
jgi:RNA polymerase sigma-70 factor (ECF subfamily)